MNFNDIFKSVQAKAESETTKTTNNRDNVMSFTPGNEYLLRCVPYQNSSGDYKYFCKVITYSWKDTSGHWWNITSPYSVGDKCPIMQFRNSYKEQHTERETARLSDLLRYKNATYFNALIVNDPVNPSNNGTVKIINGGKELSRIVMSAVNGKLDSEYAQRASDALGKEVNVSLGPNIFNLTDSGWNLLVKPFKGNPAVSYKASMFTKNKSKLGFSEEKQEEIVANAFDLDDYYLSSIKSYQEVGEIFKAHFIDDGVLDDGYSTPHNDSSVMPSSDDDDFESMLSSIPDDQVKNSRSSDDIGDPFGGEDNIPF